MKNYKIMTVDLEPDLRSQNCKSMEIVPKLLDYFQEKEIKATFFVVTSLLNKHESVIKEISLHHEIASHSHTHSWLNGENAELEIKTSQDKLKEYGFDCIGYRAPRAMVTNDHFELLKKYGYKYDSSLASFFPGRYYNFNLSKKPFFKKDILEFPIPTFAPMLNSSLSYLKLLDPVSKMFKVPYLFYLHPWEFLEKIKNDHSLIETALVRNSGEKAWKIFDDFLNKEECKWIGCKGWMERETIKLKKEI